MLGIVMDELKNFFIKYGFDKDKLDQETFNVTNPNHLINLFETNEAMKAFLEFSRNLGLTPYSKQNPCLLFSIRENGKTVKGTTIGGFGTQTFELSGSRLNFDKLNINAVTKSNFINSINDLKKYKDIEFEIKQQDGSIGYMRIHFDSHNLNEIVERWLGLVKVNNEFENIPNKSREIKSYENLEGYMSLNNILYGPPGTGKTYHTVEAAVKAAEPEYYEELKKDEMADADYRSALKAKYDELVKQQRIRFVTFHQSYGYEEFVEGLKAKTNESRKIEYAIEPGIFKSICENAAASRITAGSPLSLKNNNRVWKLSLDGVKTSKLRDYCFDNGLAAIGWGDTGNLTSEHRNDDEKNYWDSLSANERSSLTDFSENMSIGDVVVCIAGQWGIQAVGIVAGDYQYKDAGTADKNSFCHTRKVDWLVKNIDVNIYELNQNTRLTLKTCYELTRFSAQELFSYLKEQGIGILDGIKKVKSENYVLIIDEINRGNISKIFGELITLIEPSKRSGNAEKLSVSLSYSGKPFSVPDNLYIIGTMNTADRSLATMDTALRRRFDFVEMMPTPDLLENKAVNGIDLTELLKTLNQRIEVLYDREHALGHAFFMPVKQLIDSGKDEEAFSELVSVFKNKIIPLLQEYFFEDWQKIRLVLGDNQRKDDLHFIHENKLSDDKLKNLFGSGHNLNQYGEELKQYQLRPFNDVIWTNAETYIGIYSSKAEEPKTANDIKTDLDQ